MKSCIKKLIILFFGLTGPLICFSQNTLNQYEYWYDGNWAGRTIIPVIPSPVLSLDQFISTSGLNPGVHIFNMRISDNSSRYSSVISQLFYKPPDFSFSINNNITAYEYWIDNEYAYKVFQNTAQQNTFQLITEISVSSLTSGVHIFNIRFKDIKGLWSSVTSQLFYKPSVMPPATNNNITAYEYWFDTDYTGKVFQGTAPQSELQLITDISTATLAKGIHIFNIRFKDERGKWSSVISNLFYKGVNLPVPNLVNGYRYWIDSDISSMTYINLPVTTNPRSILGEIHITDLNCGPHKFNLQARDLRGLWSDAIADSFYYSSIYAAIGSNSPVCTGGTLNLTSNGGITYSWTGPNGFTSTIQNPSIVNVTPAATGTYTVRATDVNGCMAVNTVTVMVNPVPAVNITINATGSYCQGQSILLTANVNGTGNSYLWSTVGTTQSIYISSSGIYSVTVTNPGGCISIGTVNVNPDLSTLLSSYVILANNHVNFNGTQVMSGGVGVKKIINGKIDVHANSFITAAGTFARAATIHVDPNSAVTDRILSPVTIPWPPFQDMPYTGTTTVHIPNNTTVFLSDTLYKEVNIGKNATAIFTKPVVNIQNPVNIDDGGTMRFMQCGKVRIKNHIEGHKKVTINPDNISMVFYVDGDLHFQGGAHINGIFFLGDPNSPDTTKHNFHVDDSQITGNGPGNTGPGIFTGMFMAQDFDIHKNNYFYLNTNCNNCPAPPSYGAFTCPSNITICNEDSAFILMNMLPPYNNIASITNNQPPKFPVGITTVTWTVTLTNHNVITCRQLVTRSGKISVKITSAGEFCGGNEVILTANVTGTPAVSYLWSSGETTTSILADTTGVYNLEVDNSFGCYARDTIALDLNPQNLISSYVMYAQNHVAMKKTTVMSGGVGIVKTPDGKIDAQENTLVTAAGTFAKAMQMNIDGTSSILNKYYGGASAWLPKFEANPYPGSITATVADNATVTLSDTLYKEVKIGKNARVTFTKAVVNIQNALTIGDGSTVHFAPCSKVRVKGGISGGQLININPDSVAMVFYVQNNVSFKKGTRAWGIFFLGNAGIPAYQISTEDSRTVRASIFKGMFIANEIVSNQNTYWYLNSNCGGCLPLRNMQVSQPDTAMGNMVLQNYPNPFNDKTTVEFILPTDNNVTLDVYDITGKWVQRLYNDPVYKNQEYKAEFDGTALPAGIYIYRMTTNEDVFTGKMILNKE